MTSSERKAKRSPTQPVGRWIRVDKRLAIYLRDRFTCVYCGRDLHGAKPHEVTLDHLVCQRRGHDHGERNLVTACESCNKSRQDTPWHVFVRARFESRQAESVEARVRRQSRLSLAPFRVLAKSILAGTVGRDAAVRQVRRSK